MSKEKSYKFLIIFIIALGCFLRLTVFAVSPPNNSYDDHLEVIHIYAQTFSRPGPFQCWECYQPPVYYYLSASVYKMAELIGLEKESSWKLVQLINPFLSILVLIISYWILLMLKIRMRYVSLIMSFLAVLPRDIFTSAMIGNDYLLTFFSISAFYLYLKVLKSFQIGENKIKLFGLLILFTLLGSLTKQHGLLLHILPAAIILTHILKRKRRMLTWMIPLFILGALFSLSEEYWKYKTTGKILVSNQHYFDYTEDQPPGSLDKVEFSTFRIVELFKEPFISEKTSASIATELFSRTFFDYEWRFLSPKIPGTIIVGRISYSVGILWMLYFFFLFFFWIRKSIRLEMNMYSIVARGAPIVLSLFFMTVPLIQTIRYPYFSSMKSMFMLPGIIMLLLAFSITTKVDSILLKYWQKLIVINIAFGVILVVCIFMYIGVSLNHLSGPLWAYPR